MPKSSLFHRGSRMCGLHWLDETRGRDRMVLISAGIRVTGRLIFPDRLTNSARHPAQKECASPRRVRGDGPFPAWLDHTPFTLTRRSLHSAGLCRQYPTGSGTGGGVADGGQSTAKDGLPHVLRHPRQRSIGCRAQTPATGLHLRPCRQGQTAVRPAAARPGGRQESC